ASGIILQDDAGKPVGKYFTNTFVARFNNTTVTPNPIPAGGVKAIFRIANWGSQPNLVPWEVIPNGAGPGEFGGAGPDGTSGWPTAAPTNNGARGTVQFPWTANAAIAAPFLTHPHQCMLVELSGPGLTFANNSVARNMDFVTASRFE